MNEYELSLDNIFFFDAQIVGSHGKEFIASIVWLHNFQWSSWTRGVDGNEVLINQWNNSDAIVSFDEEEIVMSLMKSQFGLKYDAYINLVDYCDNHLTNMADEVGIAYPAELLDFKKSDSTKLWMEFIQGNDSALNSMLFFGAWNTDLIYHIFFQVCGDTVPLRVFIPWALEKQPTNLKVKRKKGKVQEKDLYNKLKRSYDFSSPGAAIDE
ncbi:MAG: hypothetical protein KAS17_00900 [Victivallaceae bacterium]|nr:hypothetical protein [Victivallaceae bacterium]